MNATGRHAASPTTNSAGSRMSLRVAAVALVGYNRLQKILPPHVGIRKLNKIKVEKQIGKGTFSFETGMLAKQSAGCCTVQFGDTLVLAAVVDTRRR